MIYIGSDHGGFDWKQDMVKYLTDKEYEIEDLGAKSLDPHDDYPEFAQETALKLIGSEDENAKAILLCRGGQGMAMAANRFKGIRAAVVWNHEEARMTRLDNDANVLCIPADHIDKKEAYRIIDTFLKTEFSRAPRHIRRLKEIDKFYPNI